MSPNVKVWLHGLAAAAISSFSTAGGAFLVLPDVFNFSEQGLANAAKVVLVPTGIAVFAYLRTSPVPPLGMLEPGDRASIQDVKIAGDGTVTGSSATVQKANPNP